MTLSSTAPNAQSPQALPSRQDEFPTSAIADGLLDWMPTSFTGIVSTWLSKITTSDVAHVGDLMINGRENAVYAERPPVRK